MTTAAGNQELQELYRELILDHARTPRNFGRLDAATHSAEGVNPLCGDKLRLYLRVDSDDRIAGVSFEGSGCAISLASASLLTEVVSNLPVADADACFSTVTRRLTRQTQGTAATTTVNLSKLQALDGVRDHPSRIKCATLAWHALHAALHQQSQATTE